MNLVIEFLVAMAATVAFAVLFSVPKNDLLLCGISGALGWIFYYVCTGADFGPVFACLLATFILTFFSRAMAVIRKNPATVYLLTGIFPLVPGAGIYYTAYGLITGDNAQFSAKGIETLEIAFAITFGIIFGFAIPQALFHKLGNWLERHLTRE
ncbi:MAG: threonine/serine exporter family protein [Muribaculaceae bacterium]|nr:threonine/serine exporter family protein [Muribaculaceae bacterium]MCM1493234.1 threonine/serine exporter family protein [Muribaculaceae bacterium]